MESLLRDVRFGLRMLTKSPGFTAIAILILALGIGANTAFFSVVYGVLLKPLPFDRPEQLYTVWGVHPNIPEGEEASLPDFVDWRAQNTTFENLVAAYAQGVNFSDSTQPIRLRAARVTAGFFETFRVKPIVGRTITNEDDRASAAAVALIGESMWKQRFNSDPQILGKAIKINSKPYTIVGVAPANFSFPDEAEIWTPLALDPARMGRRSDFLPVFGRLQDGVSPEQAQAEMNAIAARLAQAYPDTNRNWSIRLVSLHERLVGKTRIGLLALWSAVGLVLLIVCANLANLLLARGAARQRELAIRSAMGARRSTIVRQLMSEMLVLAVVGGTLGVLLALWLQELLIANAPMGTPRVNQITLDAPILLFALGLTLVTPLLFGVAPALSAARANVDSVLKAAATRASAGIQHARLRRGLVVVQLALSLTLLIGAGLLVRSFHRLQMVDAGMRADKVTTFRVVLPPATYKDDAQLAGMAQRILEKISAIPGVKSASFISQFYVTDPPAVLGFGIEGRPDGDGPSDAHVRFAGPNFHETVGVPVKAGRGISASDQSTTTPVVVINRTLAERFFGGKDPIGKRIAFNSDNGKPVWRQVVGVVENVRQDGLEAKPYPEIIAPFAQFGSNGVTFAVHTGTTAPFAEEARRAVQSLDPTLPIFNVNTVEQLYSSTVAERRFLMVLFGGFALVALVLASLGVYGVIAQFVAQRSGEFGIRMALGAQPADIARLVIKSGFTIVAIGTAVGIVSALAFTRFLRSLLYEVNTSDPLTFGALVLVVSVTALLASYLPARRAMRTDPMVALRLE